MLLADRYRLDMPLGNGGMGEVWMAVDEWHNRPVAVKLLTGLVKSDGRARFHREARIAARLDHPRIVTVHDFGITDDCCFLTTELVNGSSLAHQLLQRGRLSPVLVATAAAQAAEGLAEAHRQGVVHGDIKPSNLLLDGNGMVKIADFGVAWCPGSQTTDAFATGPVGTSRYPAPEAALGADADAPGDVYALGCTLYELLTGSPLFTGGLSGSVPCQDLPDVYGDILPRMLANSPQERPEAAEVADWFARASARAEGHIAELNSGGGSGSGSGSGSAKRTATARHAGPAETPAAASAGGAADSTEPAPRRRRWPAVTGAVTTAVALAAGVVALTTPTTGGSPGTGSFPRPTASEPTVPRPATAQGASLQTSRTPSGSSLSQQPSAPPQTSTGSGSRPAAGGPTAPGPLSPTAATSGPPSTAPTTAPPPTSTSPTPSPSTSPSPTASSPSNSAGES